MAGAILGKDRLRAKLQALPVAIKKDLQVPLVAGANQIVGQMRGLLENDHKLKEATDWKFGGPPSGPSGMLGGHGSPNEGESDLKITIFSGSHKVFWARWREFGTMAHSLAKGAVRKRGKLQEKGPHHPGERASPFFFPVWRANRKPVLKAISKTVNDTMKKIAKSQ